MKKLLVSVIALFGAVSLSAQDVTAIYNEAAAAFGAKNFTEAATKFEQVIDQKGRERHQLSGRAGLSGVCVLQLFHPSQLRKPDQKGHHQ